VEQVANTVKSKQKVTVAQAAIVIPGGAEFADSARIEFHEDLSGLAASGLEAVYQASLGFGGLVADADLSFAMLSGPTIEGLITDIFAQLRSDLPDPLKPNLRLDLSAQLIEFLFPPNTTDAFVSNFTTDLETTSALALAVTTVPEPHSTWLIGLGAVAMLCRLRSIRLRADSRPRA
jgi:hypothetical protein